MIAKLTNMKERKRKIFQTHLFLNLLLIIHPLFPPFKTTMQETWQVLFKKLLLQCTHVDWLVRVDCVNRVAHVDRAGRLRWQAGVQWGV